MRPDRLIRSVLCAALAALAGCASSIDGTTGGNVDAQSAFARIKALAGVYQVQVEGAEGPLTVSYETVSGGHAVLERLAAGTADEMVSIYFLEERDLVMTHYCGIGNRPHLRLDRRVSTIDDLVFDFDPATTGIEENNDPHIHGARFRFAEAGAVDVEWDFWQQGASDHKKLFPLRREPGSFTPLAGS